MNYDKKYDIRLATRDDVDQIMTFINIYWRKNHILARNRELFNYEHVDGQSVSFLLAVDRETSTIEGLLGYIPASKNLSRLDIWTGIWKVKDKVMPLLGMELYKRLQTMVGARSLLGVGDSQVSTGPLLRKLTKNFNTWRMNHYYYLNPNTDYKIARIINHPARITPVQELVTNIKKMEHIDQVESFIDLDSIDGYPFKDLWYINHRYFNHPIYKYEVFGLEMLYDKALLVIRLQEYEGSKVARIVDYIGKQKCFSGLSRFFQSFLDDTGCEYVDFYVYGFDEQYIKNTGFVERVEDDVNVIPNYFYPFLQKNIDIWVSGNVDEALFCKADGDQDRPN